MFKGIKRKIKEIGTQHTRFECYILILLGMSLLPLIIIGKYNVMSADDYSMGKQVHHVWMQTGSILATLQCAVTNVIRFWHTWMGYFSGTFLGSLNPAFFSERLTWMTPVLMLGMTLFGTYWFVKAILIRYYKADKKEILLLWGLMVFLLIQTLPSPVEAVYWYGGACLYTFLHYAMLLLFAFLIMSEQLVKRINIFLSGIGIALYAFIIGGGQYGTVLQCLLWYIIYLFLSRKKLSWNKLLPFFTLLLGFGISFMAPGNAARQSAATGMSPILAILHSFVEAFHYLRRGISPLLIVCLLGALPVIWQIVKRRKEFTYPFPLLITVGSYCLFAAAFTPSLYGVGNVDAGRLQNQIQSIFYAMLWVNAFYWTGWMQDRVQKAGTEFWQDCSAVKNILKKYLWAYRWLTFAGILLVIVGTADKNTFFSMSALRSLLNGEAQAYYEQAQERLVLYQDESVSIVEIEPFRVKPRVLFFTDIVEEGNANYWINENIAQYYDKEKVLLMEKGE